MGLYAIAAATSFPILLNRGLIISLPAAYLLFARAVVLLPFDAWKKMIGVAVLAVALIGHLFFGLRYYSKPVKYQFREAERFLVQRDPLYKESIIVASVTSSEKLDYYFQKENFTKRVAYNLEDRRERGPAFQLLDRPVPKNIWYIYMHCPQDREFVELLETRMRRVEYKKFRGGGVCLFQDMAATNGS